MRATEPPIVPSLELIRRTIETEVSYTLSRLRVLKSLRGNPVGIAFRRAGKRGWALMARNLPVPSFNAVVGLEAGDEKKLASIVQWYRRHKTNAQIEIVPGCADDKLLSELARLGYRQCGFHASLIARPKAASAPDPAIDIARVTDPETFEAFLDAYIAGWGLPDGAGFKRNVRAWPDQTGWTLFFARVDGKPAASAVLYVREDFAYLADAATDPAFRGRGLQSALLLHRLRHAVESGANYASSGAAFLSTSHRNMVRAGMTLQFVRALWTSSASNRNSNDRHNTQARPRRRNS